MMNHSDSSSGFFCFNVFLYFCIIPNRHSDLLGIIYIAVCHEKSYYYIIHVLYCRYGSGRCALGKDSGSLV